jgi:DNA-binding response OmpR family regulator
MAHSIAQPPSATILWVEGRWSSNPNFIPTLRKKGHNIKQVSTGKAALILVANNYYDLVVVNAASMRSSGKRICKSIHDSVNEIPILVICEPEKQINQKEEYVNVVLTLPFTTRKLENRILPLLPGEGERTIKAGSLILDLERKQVHCHGRKTTLTPRLIQLLKMLINHKGEVVDRDHLFKKVWNTNYTGDTRTLDVHISWLRKAIEINPRKPKILITIRRKGYRLDA